MSDFARWLHTITDGLPADVSQEISAEYSAHFEDAMEDFQAQGYSLTDSETIVLGNLGKSDLVNRRLKDVHLGRPIYLSAMYASMLLFLLYSASHLLYAALNLKDGSLESRWYINGVEIILTTFSIYVLIAMCRLLEWRYDVPDLVRLIAVIGYAMLWQGIAVIISRSIYDYSSHEEAQRIVANYTTLGDLILLSSIVLGRFMMGCGLSVLGWRVLKVSDSLFGLRPALGSGVLFMGLCAASNPILLNIGLGTAAELTLIGMILGHVFIWPIAIMLFYRVLYRNPIHHPIQTA